MRLLLATIAGLTLAAAPIGHEQSTSKKVTAKLAYRATSNGGYAVSLLVVRHGNRVFNATVPTGKNAPYGAAVAGQHSVSVLDLEGDNEPEVLVDLWTQQKQCCLFTLIYRWLPGRKTYVARTHLWGAATYRVADLRGDGKLEFQSGDPRFAGVFADREASRLPLQLWEWKHGQLRDVTRQFPALIRADADAQSSLYKRLSATGYPVRGAVAAWVADEALLGQATRAFERVAQLREQLSQPPDARRGSFAAFVKHLRASLKTWGYLR